MRRGSLNIVVQLIILAGLLFFTMIPLRADTPSAQSYFEEGNNLYQNNRFSEALNAYKKADALGAKSSGLYYNMGNTYFRSGQIGRAVLYYARARRLDPNNSKIEHSLQIAQSQSNDDIAYLPDPFWVTGWRILKNSVGFYGLFTIGIVLYLIVMGLVAHWIWFKDEQPWRRRALMVLVPLAVLFIFIAYWGSMNQNIVKEAVVLKNTTPLLVDPESPDTIMRDIHEGLILTVEQENEDWIQVRIPNGEVGWVAKDAITKV